MKLDVRVAGRGRRMTDVHGKGKGLEGKLSAPWPATPLWPPLPPTRQAVFELPTTHSKGGVLALEKENAALVEEIRHVEAEIGIVSSETDACLASLPTTRMTITETAEFLHLAQSELAEFEHQIAHRRASVSPLECHAPSKVQDQAVLQQVRRNLWLRQRADELEEEQLSLFQRCQAVSQDAVRRLERARLLLRHDLERKEHQAREVERMLQDCGALDGRLQSALQDRLQRGCHELEAMGRRYQLEVAEAAKCRAKSQQGEESWLAERKGLSEDISHLEAHVVEMRAGIKQLELEEEKVESRNESEEQSAGLAWGRAHAMQSAVGVRLQRARAAEQAAASLSEQQLMLERRSLDLLSDEYAQCSELQVKLRSAGQVREQLDDPCADAQCRAVGAEARQASEELREAQSQAQLAEDGLRDALSELQQQQDILEFQLKSLLSEPDGHAPPDFDTVMMPAFLKR